MCVIALSVMVECVTCGKQKDPRNVVDSECWRCRHLGIGITFVGGGGYTKRAFHNATNKEVREYNHREALKSGRQVEPKSSRAVLI